MHVEMCPEAHEGDEDVKCCWRLEKTMYGTRSVAQHWQHEIRRRMFFLGICKRSQTMLVLQSFFKNCCLVLGDDFLVASEEPALKQFKDQLAMEWKIKSTHIGEAEHLEKTHAGLKQDHSSSSATRNHHRT